MIKTDTDLPETQTTGRRRWAGLAAIALSALLIALDSTMLFTAVPTLSARLGASTTQWQWIPLPTPSPGQGSSCAPEF